MEVEGWVQESEKGLLGGKRESLDVQEEEEDVKAKFEKGWIWRRSRGRRLSVWDRLLRVRWRNWRIDLVRD